MAESRREQHFHDTEEFDQQEAQRLDQVQQQARFAFLIQQQHTGLPPDQYQPTDPNGG